MKSSAKSSATLRIAIVEDHHAIREAFALWIDHQEGLQTVGQAATHEEARRLLRESRPDVLVFDLIIGAGDGIAFLKELKAEFPQVPVLVYSTHDETLWAEHAFRAGASGYLMKSESSAELLAAIREVAAGRLYASARIKLLALNRLIDPAAGGSKAGVGKLTARELHIFQLIGHGLSPAQIAAKLGISQRGVEAHRENIKNKLGCQTATELAQQAARWVDQESRRP